MDSRDRCPDCGDEDHHGCDRQPRVVVEAIVTESADHYVLLLLPKAAPAPVENARVQLIYDAADIGGTDG